MSKSRQRPEDPHAAREAQKYERPIPSREFIIEQLKQSGKPLSFNALAGQLELIEDDDQIALQRRLNAMERAAQIIRNRRGGYCLPDKLDLVRGRITAHADGFGFLIPEEGGDDVFLSARQMRSVLHGDKALVRIMGMDRRGRPEGAVVEVIERNNQSVVGRYFEESGIGFVTPDNARLQDVLIPAENRGSAKPGQIVVAVLTEQPTQRSKPMGRISEVLGEHMDPGMEIDIAIRSHGLPHEWPQAVMDEAARFGDTVPAAEVAGREDLRDTPLLTIDGEDARDFDDAVFCEPHGKGWRLLVAIADVSAYVGIDSELDREAITRGNSVYFPERVIPMLPEILSNGLCSLNPDVDRLCMVCEMVFNHKGKMEEHRFFPAVMRSHARLTYNKVAAMLVDGDMDLRRQYAGVVPHLEHLYELYQLLRKTRDTRGAIDFDTDETRIVFGEGRKIERIVPVIRNDAHKLIEECMIAANVAAATFLAKRKLPTLYRVHEGPDELRLADLRDFLREVGLTLGGGDEPEPKHFAKLLESLQDRPDKHMIQMVMLRTLKQAVYAPDNIGHFGLALDKYAHFTSPIRRYPDLLVHRALKHAVTGRDRSDFEYGHGDMTRLGEQCSMTERRADDATRAAIAWLKCEYMMDKVGETYEGTVTAVTGFGLFIELDEIYVEGLVHVTALDNDYYHFDPISHCLIGENSEMCYRISDRMKVKVARVDLDDRKIDFDLVEVLSTGAAYSKRKLATVRKGKKAGKKKTAKKGKKTAMRRKQKSTRGRKGRRQ
ncbi:MAG: ribonuclease R [Granulosicoccaceae bacterium]|jgi:ribonuclease R